MRLVDLCALSSVLVLAACSATSESPPPPTGVALGGANPGVAGPGAGAGAGTIAAPGGAGPMSMAGADGFVNDDPQAVGATSSIEAPPNCGDGYLTEDEGCDDGNLADLDGCASNCLVETGFSCANPGQRCLPIAVCGDGVVGISEQCDDGNRMVGDGCSDRCKFEIGWTCGGDPYACRPTTCGDGVQEGAESCDDGNARPFDGCSEKCIAEPKCTAGAGCTSECGDGLVIGEDCDDGNTLDGDGCSSTCTVEQGFTCQQILPQCETLSGECILRVPAIFRDFPGSHSDFGQHTGECTRVVEESGEVVPANVLTKGLVQNTLDADGRPQLMGAMGIQECDRDADVDSYVSITSFADWFRDEVPQLKYGELVLFENGNGGFVNRFGDNGEQFEGYEDEEWADPGDFTCSWCLSADCTDECTGDLTTYDGNPLFFPVDDITGATADMGAAKVPAEYGYIGWPYEEDVFRGAGDHNFYFTTEVQAWIAYDENTNAVLDFTGDDDVWVFVNGQLAVDLGGIHVPEDGTVTISPTTAQRYGLMPGNVYNITVFQAERRMEGSTFRLTLSGFESTPSECQAYCGDGIVSFGEECDDGINDGGYGECAPNCRLGEFCGDGVVNGPEACDTGPISLNGCNGCRRLTGAK